jgi:hypothetical protein
VATIQQKEATAVVPFERKASRVTFEENDLPEGEEWNELFRIEVDALDLYDELEDSVPPNDLDDDSSAMTREVTDVTCYEDFEFKDYLSVQLLLDCGSNLNCISPDLFQQLLTKFPDLPQIKKRLKISYNGDFEGEFIATKILMRFMLQGVPLVVEFHPVVFDTGEALIMSRGTMKRYGLLGYLQDPLA